MVLAAAKERFWLAEHHDDARTQLSGARATNQRRARIVRRAAHPKPQTAAQTDLRGSPALGCTAATGSTLTSLGDAHTEVLLRSHSFCGLQRRLDAQASPRCCREANSSPHRPCIEAPAAIFCDRNHERETTGSSGVPVQPNNLPRLPLHFQAPIDPTLQAPIDPTPTSIIPSGIIPDQ